MLNTCRFILITAVMLLAVSCGDDIKSTAKDFQRIDKNAAETLNELLKQNQWQKAAVLCWASEEGVAAYVWCQLDRDAPGIYDDIPMYDDGTIMTRMLSVPPEWQVFLPRQMITGKAEAFFDYIFIFPNHQVGNLTGTYPDWTYSKKDHAQSDKQ